MKNIWLILTIVTLFNVFISSCTGEKTEITLETLLDEMMDRENMAMFPSLEYKLMQCSSYDRRSVSPEDKDGWFANKDNRQFIRTETNAGRKEWVLMEHKGPGALARVWMPDRRITPNVIVNNLVFKDSSILRIYLDGDQKPVVEGNPYDLFNGTTLAAFPFGHKSRGSAVSFLPIPWSESCKITLDQEPLYYIFTYRAYPEGTKVKSFTADDLERANDKLKQAGGLLVSAENPKGEKEIFKNISIPSNGNSSVDLPSGNHAIKTIKLKLNDYDTPQVTRSLVLSISFDGKETVWCPVGDFFGTGIGLHPFKGWYRTISGDGSMNCRWVMPYQKEAKIKLANLLGQPVNGELSVMVDHQKWDERSMYFHANWKQETNMNTIPRFDWNYIKIKGKGVYVGDALTVYNPVHHWWGEGDAKIWVDNDTFPSLFGTGTEDYYGYSWGGRNREFYEHPFHAQVRVDKFDKNYPGEVPIVYDTKGYSTETRARALDAIPFNNSITVDMEIFHHNKDAIVDYSVATYWYALPGVSCNIQPMPGEAKRTIKE